MRGSGVVHGESLRKKASIVRVRPIEVETLQASFEEGLHVSSS